MTFSMQTTSITVQVADKYTAARDIVVLDLIDPTGRKLPPFTPGAHIDVEIRPDLVRQYSLCNPASELGHYRIAVLKESESRGGSLAMHEISEGDILKISEPRNHFELDRSACRSLLFAGGIGITPLLCMADYLHRTGGDFELHYCARTRDRMAFHRELSVSEFANRIHLHLDDGSADQKLDLNSVLKDEAQSGAHLYVCGPAGFIEIVLATAVAHDFASEALHREFFAVEVPQEIEEGAAFKIKIASTGQILDVAPDRSALEVMHEHGIPVPASCETGICGTCITKVLAGIPDHRDFILNAKEREAGDQFTPCCSRAKSPLLVLDI